MNGGKGTLLLSGYIGELSSGNSFSEEEWKGRAVASRELEEDVRGLCLLLVMRVAVCCEEEERLEVELLPREDGGTGGAVLDEEEIEEEEEGGGDCVDLLSVEGRSSTRSAC